MVKILRELARLEAEGCAGVAVTVIGTRGSTPGDPGARMLVYPDGKVLGSIGGGCMENEIRLEALEALRDGRPRTREYRLDDDVDESGMICGGTLRVLIEPLG